MVFEHQDCGFPRYLLCNLVDLVWLMARHADAMHSSGEDDSVESVLNSGSYNSLVVAVLGDRNSKPVR
jgi:hypothetical protein